MPRTPRVERTCLVCDVTFEGTPKATRCKPCRDAGHKVPTAKQERKPRRTCLECRKQFTLEDEGHVNCPSCAEMLGVFQHEMTPEQRAKALEAERLSLHLENLQAQNDRLTARSQAKPKGYPKMQQRTATSPLGILWVQLCAADGAASSIMYERSSF